MLIEILRLKSNNQTKNIIIGSDPESPGFYAVGWLWPLVILSQQA